MPTAATPPRQRFNMRYLPVDGSHVSQEQADRWGPFLADRDGLSYEELLDEALGRGSPVRDDLQLDDAEAARQYRLDQVRHYARSVDVAYEVRDARGHERTHRHRAFHPVVVEMVEDEGEQFEQVSASFRPNRANGRTSRVTNTFDILSDGASRSQLLRRFGAELDALVNRWDRYADTDRTLRGQLGERLQRAAGRFLSE